ncbi:Zinc knuckle [Fusarium albosuccineum]|uniref:Zinc knuckle n=1 Tax=Fusarium albosuccineum TaxID=1237068 RepID=A0A8H4NUB7_9HYPO|nr:Zinc knuckle [Fusarium albosuccineum]
MADPSLVRHLTHVFNACLKLSYHPSSFKHATTVILRKPGKDTYDSPRSWRPIALLPCIGKMLEKVIANRLKELVLDHSLLPNMQYGLTGRCTTKALQYLLNPIYRAWGIKKRLKATLMGLDIKGAFNHVDRIELLKALMKKGVPDWLILFVWSFLSSRSTTLKMPGSTSDKFWVNIGIPQGSPMSPILFLFFAAPIIEEASNGLFAGCTIYTFAYIDDTYLLAISKDYKTNCNTLEKVHNRIISWANGVGVSFSPEKYHVMHFKRPWSRDSNCKLMPNIPGIKKEVKDTMTILGVEVDRKLQWHTHITKVQAKVQAQMHYLKLTSGSIWGPNLKTMKQLYITKIRPIITYACGAWFIAGRDKRLCWGISRRRIAILESLQYRCLLRISGAMSGTPRKMLEKELNIDSIAVTLNRVEMAQRAISYLSLSFLAADRDVSSHAKEHSAQRAKALNTPEHKVLLRERMKISRGGEDVLPHPYDVLNRAAQDLRERAYDLVKLENGFRNKDEADTDRDWANPSIQVRAINDIARGDAGRESEKLWDDYRRRYAQKHDILMPAVYEFWGSHSFAYYMGLSRAQSTILLQCRTGIIGLNDHLFSKKAGDTMLPNRASQF